MSSTAKTRKISGKASATKPGRPRAITDAIWKNVLVLHSAFKSNQVRNFYEKRGVRLNEKRVVQILAQVAKVSERVVVDIINYRGAYDDPPFNVSKKMKKKVEFDLRADELKQKVACFERESDN